MLQFKLRYRYQGGEQNKKKRAGSVNSCRKCQQQLTFDLPFASLFSRMPIDQFRYIKIQPNTIDLSTRLWGINPTNTVVILQTLVLRSIV